MRAKGLNRIQFDFDFEGVRYRPTLLRRPTEANLARARKQQEDIKQRIASGTFNFAEEFPEFRFKHKLSAAPERERTCNEVFDAFLAHCESRLRMRDLAFATYNGYRKLLAQIWRPKIGERPFLNVRYSELVGVVSAYPWSKKTYNNAVSTVRCAFDFGYRDTPERANPAAALTCLRITKKDRRAIDPFNLAEAEALIARIHADWGEAIGNYDEARFFTGLRPSEQIALLETDVDLGRGLLSVCKVRVLRRNKDRTKTGEDRIVELGPRALEVFRRQLALRTQYIAAGHIRHPYLFFLEDGHPIDDPEVTRRRWNESLAKLGLRQRGPYHARHTSVTWQLMTGKNLLWVAKQHGHSVQVMLTMYAAWLEGATDADIEAIKAAMHSRVKRGPSLFVVPEIAASGSALKSPEFGTSLALGKARGSLSAGNHRENMWRRGWDSNPRAGITRPSDFESAPL
ncbi:MAG: phage integrase family protein [Gammaproteobacteria bacterium]|nr:phage integrase family protein [Gammaproteobacteria bacterium]